MNYHRTFIKDFLEKRLEKCPQYEEAHYENILTFINGTDILEVKRLEAADFISQQIRLAARIGLVEDVKIFRHILDLIAPPLTEVVPENQMSLF